MKPKPGIHIILLKNLNTGLMITSNHGTSNAKYAIYMALEKVGFIFFLFCFDLDIYFSIFNLKENFIYFTRIYQYSFSI